MDNREELEEIRKNILSLTGSLERITVTLGKEIEARLALKSDTAVIMALHKTRVCGDQHVSALLELDMALHDLLNE
jgi:hypothetical protein